MDNNNQDIKLCPSCGAKNKSAYKYCNECGAALNQTDYTVPGASNAPPVYNNIPPQNPPYGANQNPPYGTNQAYYNGQFGQGGYTPYPPYGANMNAPFFGTPDFNGVSAKDVYEYTGCKPELFNKLRIQHFSGKNGPYCWPLFVLGLLLGFFGMGCWYLYHKMYKPAAAFFAGAVANMALKIYVVFIVFEELLNSNFLSDAFNSSALDSNALEDAIANSVNPVVQILDSFSSLISLGALVLAIVLPFFAYKQYKNHALNKIRAEYQKSPMPEITAIGGSRGGLVAIVSVVYGIISIFAFSLLIGWFVGGVLEKAVEYGEDSNYTEYYEELPFDEDIFDFGDGSGDIW